MIGRLLRWSEASRARRLALCLALFVVPFTCAYLLTRVFGLVVGAMIVVGLVAVAAYGQWRPRGRG